MKFARSDFPDGEPPPLWFPDTARERPEKREGEGDLVRTQKEPMVMLEAVTAHARTMKRALMVAALLVVSGAQAASADPLHGAARAPASAVAPQVAYGAFDNSLSSKPVSSIGPQGAIDLRPGAVENASFGPALSSVAPRGAVAPRLSPAPLASKPVAAAPAAPAARPYAGAPYQVAGKWYVPAYEPNYDEVGVASWYGPAFHGKAAATGETFDEMAMTAAHPTLPIPSIVRVTNLENGKTALVRLNDRGPFVDDRIIDLSKHAGEVLGLHAKGTAKVRVQYVGPAPADVDAPLTASQPQVQVAQAEPVAAPSVVTAGGPVPTVELSPATLPSPTLETRPGAPIKSADVPRIARAIAAGEGFYLQAGAFADPANAEALRVRLAAYGPVDVVKSEGGARTLNRVMVGPFVARADAEAVQARMAGAGAKSIVVARGN
jgi:rare lipoprotein A